MVAEMTTGEALPTPGASKLRVLLIAEACSPACPSVPLVGYSMASALARHPGLVVTLVTHIRNEHVLRDSRLKDLVAIDYIDTEWAAIPLKTLGDKFRADGLSWKIDTAFHYPSYLIFEYALHRKYKRRLKAGEFDLIHRLTPLSPTSASPLAYLTRTPMLIGPINGGLPWPPEYPELRKKEKESISALRGLYKVLPVNYRMFRSLKGLIAGSRFTASDVPASYRGKRYYLPENGVDPERFAFADGWAEPAGAFRFVTVGRLVPYKGVDLILEAMAGSPALRACRLSVVGEGPYRGYLEAMAGRLGLADAVEFTGNVDQPRLSEILRSSQAFAFPSLREFGGAVVLEAMASGLPSIVVDYGGPGELISPETGIGLPMVPRDQLIPKLRAAMESLAGDHDRCRQLAATAIDRVRSHYTWDVKANQVVDIYRDLLAGLARR